VHTCTHILTLNTPTHTSTHIHPPTPTHTNKHTHTHTRMHTHTGHGGGARRRRAPGLALLPPLEAHPHDAAGVGNGAGAPGVRAPAASGRGRCGCPPRQLQVQVRAVQCRVRLPRAGDGLWCGLQSCARSCYKWRRPPQPPTPATVRPSCAVCSNQIIAPQWCGLWEASRQLWSQNPVDLHHAHPSACLLQGACAAAVSCGKRR